MSDEPYDPELEADSLDAPDSGVRRLRDQYGEYVEESRIVESPFCGVTEIAIDRPVSRSVIGREHPATQERQFSGLKQAADEAVLPKIVDVSDILVFQKAIRPSKRAT